MIQELSGAASRGASAPRARPTPRRVAAFVALLSVVPWAPAFASAPPRQAPQGPDSDRAYVERIVRALAADSMRGRDAFTEDGRRTAEFLAREFAAAGLRSPEGVEGYLQRFSVRTMTPADATVRVNGRQLYDSQFAFRPGVPRISWRTGDVPVIVVGPDDEPFAILNGVANAGFDALVLVDEAHNEVFRQFVQQFRRSVRTLADAVGATVVIALVNAGSDATYEVSAVARSVEEPLANVVGTIPGRRSDEIVLFSAHFDHIGIERPFQGDSIANGANDNASGTAAVLALARYYAARGTPERTLMFAAFTAEEGGGYGSRYFSRQLDPARIVAMLNIEMIGKPAASGRNSAWITGFDRSSLGTILQEAARGSEYSFHPDPYPAYDLFYRSDNAALARLGVPAHSISTTPIDVDPDYHRTSDEVETLDFDHLASIVRAIARGAEPIVAGRATPTRIPAEAQGR
jgi:hypothetical protein